MMMADVFQARRKQLHALLGAEDGVVFFPAHLPSPRNYPANLYVPFRQNSNFLYYTGLQQPGLALLSFPDGREFLFGHEHTLDDVVWEGEQPSLAALAEQAGIARTATLERLPVLLQEAKDSLLYLSPFQPGLLNQVADWLQSSREDVARRASNALKEAVVQQRLKKENSEIHEIEKALAWTRELHHLFMEEARPGMRESDLWGRAAARVFAELTDFSYPPIITTAGEVLHQHVTDRVLQNEDLLLVDMGVDSRSGYASDITRTFPVSGVFSEIQKNLYNVVLQGQMAALEAMRPGVTFKEIHLLCCRVMTEGLVELGLMKGDPEEAVAAGAHALLFPHGLGHALGLDVHDMEDLGDVVGYGGEGLRSSQFGLNFLRFGRTLEEGYVMTVEPGLYLIPALVKQWKAEKKHESFLHYDRIESLLGFGGIRIEDNVLVTEDGIRILGEPIAKTVEEVELQMGLSIR